MNKKTMMGVMLVALMCLTMVVPAAMADATTPFVITGHVSREMSVIGGMGYE